MASGASGDGHGCCLRSLTAPGFHYDHMSPYSEKLFSQHHMETGDGLATPKTPQDRLEGHPPPLLRWRMVACRRRDHAAPYRVDQHHPIPIPGNGDPHSMAGHGMTITRATRTGLVESPLLSNGHGGFGKRPEETDRPKGRHRAPGRLREHWLHLKTSNPIESTFSTVRLRTRVTKGPGSKAQGAGDGVQAAGVGPAALAGGQRAAPGRAGACRRPVQARG